MPNLTNHVRSMITGMVTSGMEHKDIAQRLGIHRMTGSTSEQPRNGQPRVTTTHDDQSIRTSHLRNRFQTAVFTARNLPNAARRISAQTVRNPLKRFNIKTYKPANSTLISAHKSQESH